MTMNNKMIRSSLVVALALCGVGLGGCQNKLRTENEALWKQNKELEDELGSARAALEAANMDRANLQQQLADAQKARLSQGSAGRASQGLEGLEGDGVTVTEQDGQVTVSVAGDVLFDSGSATLKTTAKSKLRQIAAALNQNPTQRIRVEGHSDSDPIRKSKWRDNYHLSEARATAVRDYLSEQGVARSRMATIGHGPDRPVASNTSRTGKAQNRRVEIIVVTR
jgi:chemotaxis protein MotB